jgi:hypothetical protein
MELALPAVQALGSKTPVVDAISGSATNTHHAAALHADVEATAIATQQAR